MAARAERQSYQWLNEPVELPAPLPFAFEGFRLKIRPHVPSNAPRFMPHGLAARALPQNGA